MYSDEIRRRLRAAPFVPFTVHLSDGAFFAIPHTDFAMLTPTGRTLYVALENAPVQTLNVDHIVRIGSPADAEVGA